MSLPSSWSVVFPNKVIFLTSMPHLRYIGLLCSSPCCQTLLSWHPYNRQQPVSESEKSWWADNSYQFNDKSGPSGTQDAGFPTLCPSWFLTQKQAAIYCKDIGMAKDRQQDCRWLMGTIFPLEVNLPQSSLTEATTPLGKSYKALTKPCKLEIITVPVTLNHQARWLRSIMGPQG